MHKRIILSKGIYVAKLLQNYDSEVFVFIHIFECRIMRYFLSENPKVKIDNKKVLVIVNKLVRVLGARHCGGCTFSSYI